VNNDPDPLEQILRAVTIIFLAGLAVFFLVGSVGLTAARMLGVTP
jgi:hypothetical protein